MKCPHCLVNFHNHPSKLHLGVDAEGAWQSALTACPECKRFTIDLNIYEAVWSAPTGSYVPGNFKRSLRVVPKVPSRGNLPPEVPEDFAGDYREAALVLGDSPQASAAISRRCLQHLLRTKAGVKRQDLSKEIEEVLNSGTLPTHLADAIDAIRAIGNFAAHPLKSERTGEIMPVEPGEAEWTLDVLDGLFDFYFVQPAALQKRRDALNAKLEQAGKPKLKEGNR